MYLATLAVFCAAAVPARSQPNPVTCPSVGPPPTGGDFYGNFVDNGNISTYGTLLQPGAGALGDLNSLYFAFYYNMGQVQAFADAGCPIEVVLVGAATTPRCS